MNIQSISVDYLGKAWGKVLGKRPIAIDLFAGAGGLSLGLEQAGFDVVAAVEIDPVHASVHKYNFPHCSVLPQSVETVSGQIIRKAAGLKANTKINLVAGGAPCQGFSMIGQRALDDPRNGLVREFIRIVEELKPSYFLFENVKGLTVGKHKKFLEEIISEMESIGYQVLKPWRVLNAKHFGVPQSRERLFLIGANKGLSLPEYPQSQEGIVTCEEALGDLPDAEEFPELIHSDNVSFKYSKRASGYSALARCTHDNAWRLGYKRRWPKNILTSSLRTDHTDISRRRFAATEEGTVEPISRFFKLSSQGVSNTLRAGTDSARGAFTSPRPIHYKYARCVTVREMARLHGFPDWFRFHETKWHGARQVGNAVPPPLAYHIGRKIIEAGSFKAERPTETLELGESKLLHLDMSNASKFWGVPVPIQKRDRKSGAKKRTQQEIEQANV
ncbi:DNA cytosine methyltransferase [uncultured Microbulbifer sp.]|uniref:DNA cytosine methyltransferase n=1 Tax=uncultured Microbulbifer sp. TaxID=348147 RepID=UPI002601ADA3|nr:DNA cytosine methyltransferase [uncultured Microbulbifer sp.]